MARSTPTTPQPLRIIVVESHHHALEHIHQQLRRRRSLSPWRMLHVDAHADLSVGSQISARSCFQPHSCGLYDALDQTASGIAEWILPLVLAASLTQLEWIRPVDLLTEQLPAGNHIVHVGVATDQRNVESFQTLPDAARIKVDWNVPYYWDDEHSYAPPMEQLQLKQPLELTIRHVQEKRKSNTALDLWMLDICLDYFDCRNPFVTDLEAIDHELTNALVQAFRQSIVYSHDANPPTRNMITEFRRLWTELLEITDTEQSKNLCQSLAAFYKDDSPNLACQVLERLNTVDRNMRRQWVTEASTALPYLLLPHQTTMTDGQIDTAMDLVRCEIQNQASTPFMVTIARSANDGFTPTTRVDELQSKVLQMVHDCYCSCGRTTWTSPPAHNQHHECPVQLVFDYGEWEGSTG